jgi:hypothetical protein
VSESGKRRRSSSSLRKSAGSTTNSGAVGAPPRTARVGRSASVGERGQKVKLVLAQRFLESGVLELTKRGTGSHGPIHLALCLKASRDAVRFESRPS